MSSLKERPNEAERFAYDPFPDFREAIPTPDKLDTEGCEALLRAITIQTAEDYYKVCDHPKGLICRSGEFSQTMSRDAIEKFVRETMPSRGEKLIKTIQSLKRQKRTLKDVVKSYRILEQKRVSELDELYSGQCIPRSNSQHHVKPVKKIV